MMDSTRRWLTAIFAGMALAVLVALPAWGHAAYKSSDPADGASFPSPPSQVTAEYTEPPDSASYLRVFDPCGRQVDMGNSSQDAVRNSVTVGMNGDAAGTYRVDWFVNSTKDNHPTRGSFTFTVQNGAPCPGQDEPPDESAPEERDRQPGEPVDRDGTTGGTSGRPGSGGSSGSGGDRGVTTDRGEPGRRPGGDGSRQRDDVDEPFEPGPVAVDGPREPGLLTGIPLGGLLMAYAIAAIIGAAGGLIYAGIMGYRR
ncbi:MAG TPA: copper resistance CopC family protein [Actinomycetota bacterium]|nr:copper resistance CopC family protein [Actinomycetota bacterium]